MYYPDEIIDEIRLHNDIVHVISNYITLKKKGNSYFGLCPFHNEKTASFSVSEDKQMYYCFGCGAGGNVYTFIMEYENFSFIEAVKHLAERANITLPTVELSNDAKKKIEHKQQLLDIHKDVARYFYYQLKSSNGKRAYAYLQERGITEDIIKKFGLGFANFYRDDLYQYMKKRGYDEKLLLESGLIKKDKDSSYNDRFFNRIIYPIFDVHSRVIGFGGRVLGEGTPKYLNSPETKLFDKSKNLYGLNIARTSRKDKIIIVEGYMDVITLHQSGFNQAVASLGTALTSGQVSLLKRYTNEVLLTYDADTAGIKATLRALPILRESGLTVKVIDVAPFKDPDELIKKKGSKLFEECIKNAKNSILYEIRILEKGYNLTDPEEKTKFFEKIAVKILELSTDLERDNYIQSISSSYNINPNHFKKLIDKIGTQKGLINRKTITKIEDPKQFKKKDGITEAQKILLAYLLKDERLFNKVKNYIQPSDFQDKGYEKVATYMYDLYFKKQPIEPAKILSRFTSIEEQKQVAQVFNHQLNNISLLELEKLINEIVYRIKKNSLDYASRNAKDLNALQEIITEQSKLQKLHISLMDG